MSAAGEKKRDFEDPAGPPPPKQICFQNGEGVGDTTPPSGVLSGQIQLPPIVSSTLLGPAGKQPAGME